MPERLEKRNLFDRPIVQRAARDAFVKLDPRRVAKNPVMFVVFVGSVLTTLLIFRDLFRGAAGHGADLGFTVQVTLWLWFTVLFANFAEAMAEGRGKAQADTLRRAKTETTAERILRAPGGSGDPGAGIDDIGDIGDIGAIRTETVPAPLLRKGDLVLVRAGEVIPGDGEVVLGVASVDEAAITGESAPVIRESGGDRSAVTGGTRVLSDWLQVRITSNPGETFLDRMIALVEGAERQKTPNEIALNILLAGLTIIFLLAVVTLLPYALYSTRAVHSATPAGIFAPVAPPSITVLVALLVCPSRRPSAACSRRSASPAWTA
jgi:K+-transporting ATPase ATPase B chain